MKTKGHTELTDLDLFERLCSTDHDELLYEEFVKRFLPDVENECLKICLRRKIDGHIGTQIAHDTFERVRKYKKFKSDQIKESNARRAILVYLFQIAMRLFNDEYRKTNKDEIIHHTYFDDIFIKEANNINPLDLQRKKDISLAIFNKLNKNEQIVILTDFEHKRHHKYLPDEVLDQLVQTLGVKKDTIRKIRERAIEKIKTAINELNQ